MLELTGSGFDDTSEVYLGSNNECEVMDRNSTYIMCMTPEGTDGEVNTYVSVGGTTAQAASNFTYDEASSPEVTSFTPTSVSVQGKVTFIHVY